MNADEIFDQSLTIDFFSRVGSQEIVNLGACKVTRVGSWRQACDLRGSEDGSNAFLEATNRLTASLSSSYREEYRKWNSIIHSIHQSINTKFIPYLDARISQVATLQETDWDPNFVKEAVVWDVVHSAAEQAYAEFVPPYFYTRIFDVYRNGRFPCHWDRVWPNGHIWVF